MIESAAVVAPRLFVPDQILVKPRPEVPVEVFEAFHAECGVTVLKSFSVAGGTQLLRVPTNTTVPALVAAYRESGLVEFAHPDYIVRGASVPDDPRFLDGTLWGLNNYGQDESTPGADIHALEGWALQTSASNVVIAILDTGIRYTHEDLATNMWVNTNTLTHGTNTLDDAANPLDPADDEGHGTMIAGIIGAAGNNGIGCVGVAWQVQMMACKCLNSDNEGSDSSVIASMQYALDNGAQIVNASITSTTFSEAVSNAVASLRDAGIILVAPAGNTASDVDFSPVYPACYDLDNIVSVASSSEDDYLGFLSNYGSNNVDIAAPGDRIYSTYFTNDAAYFPETYPWDARYGTSFAAAYVSGALVLMLERFAGEDYRMILERLMHAADPVPQLAGTSVTGGRLNLRKALSPNIELLPIPGELPFQLDVSAGFNRECVVEVSTNLVDWVGVYTNATTTNWNFTFTDLESTNDCHRFYRVTSSP